MQEHLERVESSRLEHNVSDRPHNQEHSILAKSEENSLTFLVSSSGISDLKNKGSKEHGG